MRLARVVRKHILLKCADKLVEISGIFRRRAHQRLVELGARSRRDDRLLSDIRMMAGDQINDLTAKRFHCFQVEIERRTAHFRVTFVRVSLSLDTKRNGELTVIP